MSNAAKHRKRAAEFELQKQFDKAIASYKRAIEVGDAEGSEVDVALLNKVGDLTLRLGRVPEAVESYERAVEHYAAVGLFNNAIALCNKILRHAPGRVGVYLTLGRVCAKKGMRGDATRNFLEYASRMQQEGRTDEGMRALAEVAAAMPELEDVRRLVEEHAARAGIALPTAVDAAVSVGVGPGAKSAESLVFLDIDYDSAIELTPAYGASVLDMPPAQPAAKQPAPSAPPARTSSLDDLMIFDPTSADDDDFDFAGALDGLEVTHTEVDELAPIDAPSLIAPSDVTDTIDPLDSPLGLTDALGFDPSQGEADASSLEVLDGLVADEDTPLLPEAVTLALELEEQDDIVSPDSVDAWSDLAIDAPSDFATDLAADPAAGIELDVAADTSSEHATDVVSDVDTDVATDVGTEVAADAGTDVGAEVAADIDADVGTEVAADIDAEADTDVAAEVTTDGAGDVVADVVTVVRIDVAEDLTGEVGNETTAALTADVPLNVADDFTPGVTNDFTPDVTDDFTPDDADVVAAEATDETSIGPSAAAAAERDRSMDRAAEKSVELPVEAPSDDASAEVTHEAAIEWQLDQIDAEGPDRDLVGREEFSAADAEDVVWLEVEAVDLKSDVIDDEHIIDLVDLSGSDEPESTANAPSHDLSDELPFLAVDAVDAVDVVDLDNPLDLGDAGQIDDGLFPDLLGHEPLDLTPPSTVAAVAQYQRLNPHDFILPGELPPIVYPDELLAGAMATLRPPSNNGFADFNAFDAAAPGASLAAVELDALPVDDESASSQLDATSGAVELDALIEDESAPIAQRDAGASHAGAELAAWDDDTSVLDIPEDEIERGLLTPPDAAPDLVFLVDDASAFGADDELAADPAVTEDFDGLDDLEAILTPRTPAVAMNLALDRCVRLREEVEAHPGDWARRRRLAEAYLEAGELETGLSELAATVLALEVEGDLKEASRVTDELIRVAPDVVAHHMKRVELAVRLGDRDRLRESYLDLADAMVRTGQATRAESVYMRVLELDPWDDRARAALGSAAPPPPAPKPAPPSEQDGYVNLTDWLSDDAGTKDTRMRVKEPTVTGDEDADFTRLLQHFREGVSRSLGDDDYASHYDLGVAYKEMGLLDDAIAEFQRALRSPTHRLPAYEALGQCFLEQGSFPVAVTVLSRALHEPGLDDEQRVGVLYLLGYACEALQRRDEARSYFQRVYATDIYFRDVAERLAALDGGAR